MILRIFFLLLLFPLSCLAEEIYKGFSSGNIRYSDKPFPGGKVYALNPLPTSRAHLEEKKDEEPKEEKQAFEITILFPENNHIFQHDTQSLPVKLKTTAPIPKDTEIFLKLNEERLGPFTDLSNITLSPLPRGTYQLQAVLLSRHNSTTYAISEIITFYQQRPFIKK
jgi:hypothetical protein